MTKVEKTFTILLYYYYYYDYDFIIINTVSPSLATTILTFPLQKLHWVLILFYFLMRTESTSNNCHFSFTLQTLVTLKCLIPKAQFFTLDMITKHTEHIHFRN